MRWHSGAGGATTFLLELQGWHRCARARQSQPCGACRQIIWEFCGDIPVVIANLTEITAMLEMKDLLPLPFDKRLL